MKSKKKLRTAYIQEFRHVKEELVCHMKETFFFSLYFALPILGVIFLITTTLYEANLSLLIVSYAMFFLGGMLPDYTRLIGILLENGLITEYSHHRIFMLFAIIGCILFYLQFVELYELIVISLFFTAGIAIHLRSDRFEELIELRRIIPKEPISDVIKLFVNLFNGKKKE